MNKELTPLEALRELKYVHDTECGEDKSVNERFALIETALKKQIVDARRIENLELIKDIVGITFYRKIGKDLWAIELSGVSKITYKELTAIKGEYNR